MKYTDRAEAVLLLEDGTFFRGKSIGFKGTKGGEICFNTGMTGYQEIYTDPSYYGQIMVNTNAHIGNYGAISTESESDSPKIFGVVTNNFSESFSRFNGEESLHVFLGRHGVPGISDVDTRAIVRHIRSKGAMNAIISSEITDISALQMELDKVPSMEGLELSSIVSVKESYETGPQDGIKLAVMDYGIKSSILKQLSIRGFKCKVFPAKTGFNETEEWKPSAYFLSNGHQLIAQANGIGTFKMYNGHRGLNQPVKNLLTGKGEITSQNHGFSVIAEDVHNTDTVEITHVNLNDDTIEGLQMKNKKVFSVQYHPESSPGPHDSRYLFDQFISLINL
jgi:carbamoyl-phosphate synthase small subunit